MSRKFKSLLNLTTLATDPSGSVGDVFFNTTEKALKIHNGITWVTLAKNTDPVPFYMHTHDYDGEINSVFPIPLTPDELGDTGYLIADGGDQDDIPNVIPSNMPIGTLDGGSI